MQIAVGEDASAPGDRRRRLIARAVVVLTIVMICTQVGGFLFTTAQQRSLLALRNDTREMRIVQQALVDEKVSVEDYLLTGDPVSLQTYFVASETLQAYRGTALRRLDAEDSSGRGGVIKSFDAMDRVWARAIAEAGSRDRSRAAKIIAGEDVRRLLGRLRGSIARYIETRNVEGETYERRIEVGSRIVLMLQLVGGAMTLVGLGVAFRSSAADSEARRIAMREAVAAREQVESLLEMTDMLQSASDYDDTKAILKATASKLVPTLAGSLFLYNNSRDRLDLLAQWGDWRATLPEVIAPPTCWALKRGKPHTNTNREGELTCQHHASDASVLEKPIVARGEIHGLLCFSATGPDAEAQLADAEVIISALADAMSLALSGISLREKLRNQALRDSLTGLYNRRYMEDMLQRFAHIAERSKSPVSVLMLDLDNFKKLNDEHGHLVGDTVLRAVASTLTGSLRDTDVACRYGGEELAVLLPGCALEDAAKKAEALRLRIEQLSELHGVRISASIGVASMPQTSASATELLSMADAALYQAKHGGRNRVATATTVRAITAEFASALIAAE